MINYVRLSLPVYFEDQLSADCHWWRILRISYMTTLYFDVLAQNYSCLRIVSYFSSKIGLPLVADFEDQLYDDFVF